MVTCLERYTRNTNQGYVSIAHQSETIGARKELRFQYGLDY
jgi:hypothetical protein